LTHNEETFWTFKWTKESPHSTYFYIYTFEKTDRGGRKEIFKVFGLLGEGTFGQVALAKKKSTGGHSSSEEVVAIKFVPNNSVCDREGSTLSSSWPSFPGAVAHVLPDERISVVRYGGRGRRHSSFLLIPPLTIQ